jgi:hypothetical protein
MSAYSGSALVVQWVYSGGTVALNGDFRTFSYSPSVELIDQTAGSDAYRTRLTSIKDGNASINAIMQASGTAISNALSEGTEGTLNVGPEGTVAGKQKMIIPAIAMGASFSISYNDVVELSCDFTQNGARTDTSW